MRKILVLRVPGATYANVHSTPVWPGGEIRGQIKSD
jgi:hypothetical protein